MATYEYVKTVVFTQPIWDAFGVSLMIAPPDNIDNEYLTFYGQEMLNPNKIIFTYNTPLSGPDKALLDSFMAGHNGLPDDAAKTALAEAYMNAGFQIMTGLSAKAQIDGKTESQTIAWWNQIEPLMNPLQSGFLVVAYNKWTGLLSLLTNILTGTMTSTEVAEVRNLLEKLLGKTLT